MSHLIIPSSWDIITPGARQDPVPYELRLEPWASQGWKVKIFDVEGPEDPHVTIYRRASARWRLNLRNGLVMDREPPERDLPRGLLGAVRGHLDVLRIEWDMRHPRNPVAPDGSDG
jgi:hypothetical protein